MSDRLNTYLLAIQNEIKSQNLYRSLAKSFAAAPEINTVLKSLIPMEQMHEEKLREACKKEFPDSRILIDSEIYFQIKPEDLSDPVKVLRFAIDREIDAAKEYSQMALSASEPETAQLLRQLATEEEHHKTVLEMEILQMDGLLTWYDPSELTGLQED